MREQETAKAAAAFAEYCALGAARSLRKMAQNYANPTSRLRQFQDWSTRYHWQERVKQYDRERALERAAAREEMNERHAELARTQQKRALDQIQALIEARAFGSQAAVQLLKLATDLERLALGAPTSVEHQEHSGSIETGGRIVLVMPRRADDPNVATDGNSDADDTYPS